MLGGVAWMSRPSVVALLARLCASAPEVAEVAICRPGQWYSAAAHICVGCAAGTSSADGAGERCSPCAAGRWSGAQAAACSVCPSARFGVGASTTASCDGACAVGRFGGGDSSNCRSPCPAGFGWARGAAAEPAVTAGCGARCPPGRFSRKGTGSCVLCPGGKYAGASGSRRCKACAAGHFSQHLGLTYSPDAPARYEGVLGTVSCVPCARGRFYGGTGASDSSFCALCAAGRFSQQLGASTCYGCPVGKFGGTDGACSSCTQGMFQSQEGRTSCFVCPAGRFAPRSASSCGVCPRGYSCSQGAGEGQRCPAGSYAPQAHGDSRCVPCPAGTFGLGAVRAGLGAVVTRGSAARLACSPCPAGRYGSPGATSAQCSGECSAGRWGRSREKGALCSGACRAGRYSRGGGTSPSCTAACAPGSFSGAGAARCSVCAPGMFSARAGAVLCARCPPGKHTQPHLDLRSGKLLSTSCFGCPRGKWAVPARAGGGAARCAACPAGTYGSPATTGSAKEPYSQASVCLKCPAGRYGAGGSPTDSCSGLCDAGRFGSGGSTTKYCSGACLAGTFGRPGAETPSCSGACAPGRWAGSGSKSCTSCAPGRFTARKGSTTEAACSGCPQGKYAPFEYAGSSRCKACAAGTHPSASFSASRCDADTPTPSPTPAPPTPMPTTGPTPRPVHVCEQVQMGRKAERASHGCAVCGVYEECTAAKCKGSGWFHLGLGQRAGAKANLVGFRPVYRAKFVAPQRRKGAAGAAAWGEATGDSNGFARAERPRGESKESVHFYLYFYAKYAQWVVSEQLLVAPFFAASRDTAPVPQMVRHGSWSLSHGNDNRWWSVVPDLSIRCINTGGAAAAHTALAPRHPKRATRGKAARRAAFRLRFHADLLGFSAARFGSVAQGFIAALATTLGLAPGAVRVVGRPRTHLWVGMGRSGVRVEMVLTRYDPCATKHLCKPKAILELMRQGSFKVRVC